MRRLLSPLAIGLAAVLSVPLTAGAVNAASIRVTDPVNDVRTVTVDDDGNTLSEADAPGARPDVTGVRLTHARRSVTVQLTTTGLAVPTGEQGIAAVVRFEGGNKQRRVLSVAAFAERPGGRQNFMLRERNGKRVCPKAVRSRIDYAAGTVTATFPRRCVGSPKRIRVAAGLVGSTAAADAFTYDDALRRGGAVDTVASTFSPWAKRG